MNKLAGILCVRNGFELDYCWLEAAASLLGVVDELLLSDCDSTDGTREQMDRMKKELGYRVTVCNFPWTNPERTSQWYPEWINYARQHCHSEHILHLDADELIHEDDYPLIEQAAKNGSTLYLHRLNFWRDPFHLIPEGVCCGSKVLRMAPANMPIPSDYPYGPAEPTMRQAVDSKIRVFHYGFIRERKAFFKKAREVQRIWTGGFDERLEKAESFQGDWAAMPGVTGWEDRIVEYSGTHPNKIHDWLKQRGHSSKKPN